MTIISGTLSKNKFVSSEMRTQILRLKDQLRECELWLSTHSSEMDEIQDGLFIAQQCIQCLLSEDPFTAWQELVRQNEEDDD